MPPGSDPLGASLGVVLMFGLTLLGATHLRLRYGRRWLAILSCAIGFLVLGTFAVLAAYASHASWQLSITLSNPPPPHRLATNWGSNFPPAERTKYSRFMAEKTFIDWGESVEYFDLEGKRLRFAPTDADRAKRVEHLAMLDGLREQARFLAAMAALFLVLPLLAWWMSRTPVARRVIQLEEWAEIHMRTSR
jgi:hypothetical protein